MKNAPFDVVCCLLVRGSISEGHAGLGLDERLCMCLYRVAQKWHNFLYALYEVISLSDINRDFRIVSLSESGENVQNYQEFLHA